jgi:hypothetical protein
LVLQDCAEVNDVDLVIHDPEVVRLDVSVDTARRVHFSYAINHLLSQV